MTTPTEFTLWLNGAAGVMGDAPTPEQWAAIKEKLSESVGYMASRKLLEKAEEEAQRVEREQRLGMIMKAQAKMSLQQAMAEQIDKAVYHSLAGLDKPVGTDPMYRPGQARLIGHVGHEDKYPASLPILQGKITP